MFLTESTLNELTSRYGKPREEAKAIPASFEQLVKTFETVGMGTAMGYWNATRCKPGRNAIEIGGVPVDLTCGVLGQVLAMSGYLGGLSEHVHNVSNGLLTAYGVRMAMMWGADARARREAAINAAVSAQQVRDPRSAGPMSPMSQMPNALPMPSAAGIGPMFSPDRAQPYAWAA